MKWCVFEKLILAQLVYRFRAIESGKKILLFIFWWGKAVMQVTCLTCPLIVQKLMFNYTVFCLVVLSYCSKCKAVPVLNYTPHYADDGGNAPHILKLTTIGM
jgi:hypothetical protein